MAKLSSENSFVRFWAETILFLHAMFTFGSSNLQDVRRSHLNISCIHTAYRNHDHLIKIHSFFGVFFLDSMPLLKRLRKYIDS